MSEPPREPDDSLATPRAAAALAGVDYRVVLRAIETQRLRTERRNGQTFVKQADVDAIAEATGIE